MLIYGFREEFPQHQAVQAWLLVTLGSIPVGVPTLSETAFLRLMTKPLGVLKAAPWPEAWHFLSTLFASGTAERIHPGPAHPEILNRLVIDHNLSGDDIMDGWLAALAIEQRVTLASADKGFARFPELRWHNPLAKWVDGSTGAFTFHG